MVWKDDIVTALKNLGGEARYADLYEEVYRIRGKASHATWQNTIRRTIQNHSSDSQGYTGKEDLFYPVNGLGKGHWGLREMVPSSPKAVDLDHEPVLPGRELVETYRILRDTPLARELKRLYGNRCQICGDGVELHNGEKYSEAHHIKPLGRKHDGPDVKENIIVLCPNHHVQMDYGARRLDLTALAINHHPISEKYVEYHNRVVFKQTGLAE